MKKILFLSMLALITAFTSCSKSDDGLQNQNGEVLNAIFNVQAPDAVTRANVTDLKRYIVEVYEGNETTVSATQRVENSSGSFTVALKKNTVYTFVFWADYGTPSVKAATSSDYFNADDLKTVKVNANASSSANKLAYYKKVSFNSNDFEANKTIVLGHATAQINFVEKAGLPTGYRLKVTYSSVGTFNATDGTFTETATSDTRTYSNSAQVGKNETLASDYILAPVGAKRVLDITVQLNDEATKKISNVPLQCNYKTNIKGEFSNLLSKTFTVTADDAWGDPANEVDITFDKKMQFTINLTSDDKTYIIPFAKTGTTPCDLVIEWGDGESTPIPSGTDLSIQATADLLKHTYTASEMEYQITIKTVAPATQQQMPDFRPGSNRINNNNMLKLKTMDSPMLNTGSTDFSSCFTSCYNLTGKIPAALFEKNTAATNFSGCFANCSGLTGAIPVALFEKNTAATDFSGCFANCSGLTGAIPAALFEKNTAATNFSDCFNRCSGLTGEIPAALFEKNTAATNFSNCFYKCTKATLNANIFCTESTETKATRFLNQTVDFECCFEICGSDASISTGNGGTAPALWDYAFGTGTPERANCFKDVTNVTNYDQIPKAWGGPTVP